MSLPPIDLDARELMDNCELSVLVYVRRTWRIRLGLRLIRWGCRITGMHYRETSPAHRAAPAVAADGRRAMP